MISVPVALSIVIVSFSGTLQAFRTAPGHSPITHRGSRHPGIFSGTSHQGQNLINNARRDEGYEDWYVDGEDGGDDVFRAGESSSQINDDKSEDDIRRYFATCIPGLHNTLASELVSIGAVHVETQGKSGVRFEGSPKIGLKSILWCRTAHKIMELIASSSEPPPSSEEFDFDNQTESDFSQGIRNREDLYEFTKSAIHTPTLLGDGRGGLLTLSVSTIYASRAPNKELCHGHFTALTVKNALVDAVRDLREDGDRPNVDVEDSDVPIVAVIRGRRVSGRRTEWRDKRGGIRYDETYGEDDEYVADVDIYRCLHSGGSLHRRGYRQGGIDWDDGIEKGGDADWEVHAHNPIPPTTISKVPIHRAAMKESLAAGLLLEAGWDKLISAARGDGLGAVLIDPMTGSGTLPTEAALIACDMAPGLLRIASWRGNGSRRDNPHRYPPCIRWKLFSNAETWDELLANATRRAKLGMKWARSSSESERNNVKILCNEKNPYAVNLAQTSIINAGVSSIVSWSKGDCLEWNLGGEGPADDRDVIVGRTMFVCNPPWGLRLTDDIDESWVSLREFLRREASGCESWVLSGNKELTKILRMRKSRTVVVKTADEDLRWLQYHIFQKSKVEVQQDRTAVLSPKG